MKENDFLEEENTIAEDLPQEDYIDESVFDMALYPEKYAEEEEHTEEIWPQEELLPEMDEFSEEPTVIAEELLPEEYSEEELLEEAAQEALQEEFAEDELFEDALPEDTAFHEDLVAPETGDELTGDDQAMYSAGLYHHDDAELYAEAAVDNALPQEETFPDEAYRETGESSEEFLEQKMEADDKPKKQRPTRKGRPRRPKGSGLLGIPHLLATVIWLLVILAIGVSLGRLAWVCAADVLAFGRENKEVVVSITSEDNLDTIADKLQNVGLIRYKDLFLMYADLAKVEEKGKISTGTFTLNTIYDYNALVKAMSASSGSRAVVENVLIPEGYSCRQIFALLEEKGICKVAELEEYAANGELSEYWFLEGVERGDKYCLEGFLFPDTYDFYENSSPRQALEKLLNGFNYRFSEDMRAQIDTLNETLTAKMQANGESAEFIAEHQFTIKEVVTVASLIEKETSGNDESYKIASVIYNRLFSWGSTPRYLNIDATIIYALDGDTDLSAEDMTVDSPYNTYNHTGLPPTAIANPGLASLQAALDPADTSYYYYVLDPEEGTHIFSKTYEEHQAAGG